MTLCHLAEQGGDGIVKYQKYQIAALITLRQAQGKKYQSLMQRTE